MARDEVIYNFLFGANSDYLDSHVTVKSYVWLGVSVLAINFGAWIVVIKYWQIILAFTQTGLW